MFELIESVDQVRASLAEKGVCIGRVNPEAYHRWKGELPAPVVSKSSLHEFAASPWAYKWRRDNGRAVASAGFALGSAVDAALLTPELFARQYVCEEVDRRTKAGKARAAELEAAGVTALRPEEAEVVRLARDHAAHALELLQLRLGETYESQVAMWAYLTQLGGSPLPMPLIVTGMLDICPHKGGMLLDLKTTSKPVGSEKALNYAMLDYEYGVQAALYRDLFEMCTGERRGEFAFLFVETTLPCLARYMWVSDEQMLAYREYYQRKLREFSQALALDEWGDCVLEDARLSLSPAVWQQLTA